MEIKYNYEKTNFSKIYKGSYWGYFKNDKSINSSTSEIIDNRNKFIIDYNIKKRLDSLPKRKQKGLKVIEGKSYHDHMEYYYTHDKEYVVISSPYSRDEEVDLFFHKEGFSKIYDMYSKDAYTYVYVSD